MWSTGLSECCPKPFDGSSEPGTPPDGRGEERRHLTVPQRAALALLGLYKTALSPLLMSCCKFHPTCSSYAREAIERHGVVPGSRLAAGRILRCRPFAPGGIDPVPERLGRADA